MITEKTLKEFRKSDDRGDGFVYFLNEEPILQVHLFPDVGSFLVSKNRTAGGSTIFWRGNMALKDIGGFLKDITDFYFAPK